MHHMEAINSNTLHLLLRIVSSTHPLHRRPYRISTLVNLRTPVMDLLHSMVNTEVNQDTILGTGD